MSGYFSIRVPATSTNLGAGLETLGMALSLYNVFNVEQLLAEGIFTCNVLGEGSWELRDADENMVIQSYLKACKLWGLPPKGFALTCHNAIPLCRGLGSSSAAVVAGVVLANTLSEHQAPEAELLRVMTLIEGYPHNIAPCYLGGMTVGCWDGRELRYVRLPPPPYDLHVVVAVPNVRVRTQDAREALPNEVRIGDAAFNLGRAILMCAAWATGDWEHLSWGMDDRLHQQYRSRLFPGGEDILNRVRDIPGCLGAAISGSGPAVVTLVRGPVGPVASEMCRTFAEHGVESQFFLLSCSSTGTQVVRQNPNNP